MPAMTGPSECSICLIPLEEPSFVEKRIFGVLKSYLQFKNLDLPTACTKLDLLFRANCIESPMAKMAGLGFIEAYLNEMWCEVLRVVYQLPAASEEMESLVMLIEGLRQLPDQYVVRVGDGEYTAWRDLPGLRECLEDKVKGFIFKNEDFRQAFTLPAMISARNSFTSFNSFQAHLARNQACPRLSYGLYILRLTLEEEFGFQQKPLQPPVWDFYIPVAVEWIVVCGRELFDAKQSIAGDGWKPGRLWKGRPGLSKERWAFWKERLDVVAKDVRVREETSRYARGARVIMDEIEKSIGKVF